MKITFILLMTVVTLVVSPKSQASTINNTEKNIEYKESARYPFGGEGGWDYLAVDSTTRKLFIARMNRIMVINVDTGKLMGEVTGVDGAHGIAWAPGGTKAFATSGKSSEVMVFDLSTLKITDKIKVGKKPDAILYDSFSKMIFAFSGKSKSASVIDPTALKVTHTIDLGGKPESVAGDSEGHVFVDIEDKNELAVIDTKSFKVTDHFALKSCDEPTALAISPESKKLIVGCGNSVAVVVDSKTGKILQEFKAGKGVDAATFDSTRKLALISAGEGILTVLKEEKNGFSLTQEVKTVAGARTLAVDSKSGQVFLPSAEFEAPKPGVKEHRQMKKDSFYVLVVGPVGAGP